MNSIFFWGNDRRQQSDEQIPFSNGADNLLNQNKWPYTDDHNKQTIVHLSNGNFQD